MAYDLIRWAAGAVVFCGMLAVLILALKKEKLRSVFLSAAVAVVLVWIMFIAPIENLFYRFKTVEDIFSYRYTDNLIGYAECDEGVVCIATKGEVSTRYYYSFGKDADGYKLPTNVFREAEIHSSEYGVFAMESFDTQTVIITQIENAEYDGESFAECAKGYYTYTVNGSVNYSALTCAGEKISLV